MVKLKCCKVIARRQLLGPFCQVKLQLVALPRGQRDGPSKSASIQSMNDSPTTEMEEMTSGTLPVAELVIFVESCCPPSGAGIEALKEGGEISMLAATYLSARASFTCRRRRPRDISTRSMDDESFSPVVMLSKSFSCAATSELLVSIVIGTLIPSGSLSTAVSPLAPSTIIEGLPMDLSTADRISWATSREIARCSFTPQLCTRMPSTSVTLTTELKRLLGGGRAQSTPSNPFRHLHSSYHQVLQDGHSPTESEPPQKAPHGEAGVAPSP